MLKLFEGIKSKHFPSGTIYRCDVVEHELISALIQQLNNYFFSRASSFATSQLPTSQVLRPSVLTTACCVIAIAARLDPRLIYRNGWRDLVGKFIECGMISTSLSADEYVKSTLIACVQHRLEQSTPFAPAIISPSPPPPPLLEEADEVIDQQLPSYSHLFLTQKLLKHTVEPPSHLVHASEIVGAFWLRNMDRKWMIDENTQRSHLFSSGNTIVLHHQYLLTLRSRYCLFPLVLLKSNGCSAFAVTYAVVIQHKWLI